MKVLCQFTGAKTVEEQKAKAYISNTSSTIVDQRGNADNAAFDAMLLEKSSDGQNLECPMASARGDLVWRVGGGVGYGQGRWNWRVDMNVGS